MGKKKKEIKIIRKDSNKEEYTFVSSDNILNNTKIMNLQQQQIMKKSQKINLMRELRKRFIQRNHITKEERF
jgi:hypothetical protein